jgi:hypothetical protein
LSKEAEANRDSQSAAFELLDVYDGLTQDQRVDVHTILADWLVSDDNTLRYDAGFLISQRRIRSMAGAVEKALAVAESRPGIEASYEVKKFQRILDDLK